MVRIKICCSLVLCALAFALTNAMLNCRLVRSVALRKIRAGDLCKCAHHGNQRTAGYVSRVVLPTLTVRSQSLT